MEKNKTREAFVHKESTQYISGAFHGGKRRKKSTKKISNSKNSCTLFLQIYHVQRRIQNTV